MRIELIISEENENIVVEARGKDKFLVHYALSNLIMPVSGKELEFLISSQAVRITV